MQNGRLAPYDAGDSYRVHRIDSARVRKVSQDDRPVEEVLNEGESVYGLNWRFETEDLECE
tara:strand:- start:227 stop:409 length:183 start_codon:yes stop_codon:yes gene_type:complete